MGKLKTIIIRKSVSNEEERMFVDPPRAVFGSSSIPTSYSIIMEVGGLRKMLDDADLKDGDSFRIELFSYKATEYSFFKRHKK